MGIYFKSADEKRFFFDGLIKAVLNYALLQGKDTVFCENKEYFPDLFLEGFLREENKDKVFSSPEEFFSRKPCEGCSSCKS